MKIEFVTHCWQYSRLLCYQLSSFHLFANSNITVTVCFSPEDEGTRKMVDFFTRLDGPIWNPMPMSREEVCRRAIGRNRAALATKADWVWFADCDYWFGAKLFNNLAILSKIPEKHVLVYPGQILQCSQPVGDLLIEKITEPNVTSLCSSCDSFVPHAFRRAVGGIQIVRGGWALANGYCRSHTRHQRPAKAWARTTEDVTFRQDTGSAGFRIEIPLGDIVRIRHSNRGGYGLDVVN